MRSGELDFARQVNHMRRGKLSAALPLVRSGIESAAWGVDRVFAALPSDSPVRVAPFGSKQRRRVQCNRRHIVYDTRERKTIPSKRRRIGRMPPRQQRQSQHPKYEMNWGEQK